VSGHNPVSNQNPGQFATLAAERATPFPTRAENSYPYVYEHVAQLFDHPSAPDLVVVHTAAHHWGERGGHLGEHGSAGVIQARAPFIVAGAGVRRDGRVPKHARLVDVAPTILELLGLGDTDTPMATDGATRHDVIAEPGAARHVVAFLLDGTNPNVLHDAVDQGRLPNIARLIEAGTSFQHGAIASLPTVTLANHTGILTGLFPGHHGVLHNAWVDRATGRQVITNSAATWTESMQWLKPGVETLHHAIQRLRPGAVTVSINEPCDSGATFSVFELMRQGAEVDRPPPSSELPDATQRFVRPVKEYKWSSLIDHTAVEQFRGIYSGHYRGRDWPAPVFTWVNFTLTDAAFHEGGPYSDIGLAGLMDTDARIGHILDAVQQSGTWEDTAFVLVADHGMELSNPDVVGDWDTALERAGIAFRDEGYGFIYLTDIAG
jgi:hypothetical protein